MKMQFKSFVLLLTISTTVQTFATEENEETEAGLDRDFVETYLEQIFRELRASKCLQDDLSLEHFEQFAAKVAQSQGPEVRRPQMFAGSSVSWSFAVIY